MQLKSGTISVLLIFTWLFSIAQDSTEVAQDTIEEKRLKVALFTPLYLDSAYNPSSADYKQGKNLPKYFNQGLEFYEGVELAADSLATENIPLDLFVYDSKSATSSVNEMIRKGNLHGVDLIIGHVTANEAKSLGIFSSTNNIPFLNVTYPNDAGITNNPNYIILNSTLHTHCAAIYRFIQKNYALSPVIAFRKKGSQEDRLKSYFDEISRNTASVPLKIKNVVLDDNFTAEDVKQHFDEHTSTVVIAGSLDIRFANKLTQTLASINTTHPTLLFAMPTWWDATNFTRPEFKGMEVMYSTPFYVPADHAIGQALANDFKNQYYSRPTDIFYKGYETLYHFVHLLYLSGKNFSSSLSDNRFRIFSDFDIQPVLNRKTNTLDYMENKKIYMVKKVDGVVTDVY